MFFFAGCNPLKPEKTSHSIHVCMVHLPTFTIKINHPCKYTIPMDPMGMSHKNTGVYCFQGSMSFLFLGAGKDPKVAHFGPGKLQ